jgi:hypothetical protein
MQAVLLASAEGAVEIQMSLLWKKVKWKKIHIIIYPDSRKFAQCNGDWWTQER